MINLGNEEIQKERVKGPVPAGSKVLVRLVLDKPRFPAPEDDWVAQAKSGLRQLQCRVEVMAGTYEGVWWYENITLPASEQKIRLDEKQQTACRIGGSTLRAIVESTRGVDPNAIDQRAARARHVAGWTDFDGMEFPARLGIDKRPYEGKDGNWYWNNRLGSVIPATAKDYTTIRQGGEIITDGPVTGDQNASQPQRNAPTGQDRLPWDDAPHPAETDDVPF